jgi:hypothetical protein
MRPRQRRSGWLSPLVIRALGVLAITLMAMTTAPEASSGVPTCEQMCDQIAWTDCPPEPDCRGGDGGWCIPWNTPRWCIDNCRYEAQCTKRDCVGKDGQGERLECVLKGGNPPGV